MGSAMSEAPSPIKDVPANNGYVLKEIYIPKEVLVYILSFVDKKSLKESCINVCQVWREIMKEVWKIKVEREYFKYFKSSQTNRRLPWCIYHKMLYKKSYVHNLLMNNSGQEDFKYWTILKNGGDHWKVEKPPIGVICSDKSQKNNHTSAFVTSYYRCEKEQIIDLVKQGVCEHILDDYQPEISVLEWYTARWDCGSSYIMNVQLLNAKRAVVDEFNFQDNMEHWTDGWKEIKHSFHSYGPGVRYVRFSHTGKDKLFWAGHYGSKMSNAEVQILLPEIADVSYFE